MFPLIEMNQNKVEYFWIWLFRILWRTKVWYFGYILYFVIFVDGHNWKSLSLCFTEQRSSLEPFKQFHAWLRGKLGSLSSAFGWTKMVNSLGHLMSTARCMTFSMKGLFSKLRRKELSSKWWSQKNLQSQMHSQAKLFIPFWKKCNKDGYDIMNL